MNEQTVARVGSDAARSGWQPAADRADAPRPDAARPGAAQSVRPLPGTPRPPDAPAPEPLPLPGVKDAGRDAAFPTSYAQFQINPKTQRLSIKIVDAVTDEVIREIPPEQVERIAEDLQSLSRPFGKHAAGGGASPNGSSGGGVDRYV